MRQKCQLFGTQLESGRPGKLAILVLKTHEDGEQPFAAPLAEIGIATNRLLAALQPRIILGIGQGPAGVRYG